MTLRTTLRVGAWALLPLMLTRSTQTFDDITCFFLSGICVVLKFVDVLAFSFLGDNLLDDPGLGLGFGLGNGPDLSALPIESHRAISMALLKPLQMPL